VQYYGRQCHVVTDRTRGTASGLKISFTFGTFTVRSGCRDGQYSDSLQVGRSGDRIPVGARFSALIQNGPGAQSASCTVGTGYFPGVKAAGR